MISMSNSANNVNFDYKVLTIHDGSGVPPKGKKDRTVPLSESIESELKAQIEKVIACHQEDLNNDYAGLCRGSLKKYRNAGKELT